MSLLSLGWYDRWPTNTIFRAIITLLYDWVKPWNLILSSEIPGKKRILQIFTWISLWISLGITWITCFLPWINRGKVMLCHATHRRYAWVWKRYIHISTGNIHRLLIDFEGKFRYTVETHKIWRTQEIFCLQIRELSAENRTYVL